MKSVRNFTKSENFVSITTSANPTRKHNFVVTEAFIISFASGFHTPRTTLVKGVMQPDPFP